MIKIYFVWSVLSITLLYSFRLLCSNNKKSYYLLNILSSLFCSHVGTFQEHIFSIGIYFIFSISSLQVSFCVCVFFSSSSKYHSHCFGGNISQYQFSLVYSSLFLLVYSITRELGISELLFRNYCVCLNNLWVWCCILYNIYLESSCYCLLLLKNLLKDLKVSLK